MKLLIFSSLITLNSAAFACPDFSGNYFNDATFEAISITQEKCSFIEYAFEDGQVVKIATDGKEHLVNKFEDDDEIVEIYQKNTFTEDKLLTVGRSVTIYRNGKIESLTASSESILDANNNMVTVTLLNDGSLQKRTLLRDTSTPNMH